MEEAELEEVTTFGTVTPSSEQVLEAGIYTAKLEGVQRGSGDWGPYYLWRFAILDEGFEGWVVKGICNAPDEPSPLHKVYEWYTAVLGRALEVGETMDLTLIIGKKVDIQVEVKKKDDGSERNKIKALIPLKRPQRQAPPVATSNAKPAPRSAGRRNEPPDFDEPPEEVYAKSSEF